MAMRRYVPSSLTRKDKKKVLFMLRKSKKLYKKKQYYTRKKVSSFKSKRSKHLSNAYRIYNVKTIAPNAELALKTGCSIN
jgi:hypothetical protein